MARELNSEEAKILVKEEDFYARLNSNALRRIETSDTFNYTTSDPRHNEEV
jgi:hypothetical protein